MEVHQRRLGERLGLALHRLPHHACSRSVPQLSSSSPGTAGGAGVTSTCWCLSSGPKDLLSDRCILSCPSMDLVTCLLDFRLNFASNRSIVPRLAASLAACAQLSALGTQSQTGVIT